MKTNKIMIRKMGSYEVKQRTIDGMFNATHLANQWKVKNGVNKQVSDFLRLESTKEFISVLQNDINKSDSGDSLRPDAQQDKINGIISKTNAKTIKNGGRIPGEYWVHAYLFIDFSMWLNPRFKLDVIRFVYDQLIELRHSAGDNYKGITSAVQRFDNVNYAQLAKGLNYIVFGKHEGELRQSATPEQLKSLTELQKQLAFAVDMGYIRTFDELINEMRRIYKMRNTYKF